LAGSPKRTNPEEKHMPEFINPFPGMVPRRLTNTELARAIMLNIAAELEAVHLYRAHADATDNEDAKKVLLDIALEELVHAGEFTSLLYRIDPTAAQKAQEGFDEVRALLGPGPSEETQGESAAEGAPVPEGLTVGSLMGKSM
jgi:rubrerythrin